MRILHISPAVFGEGGIVGGGERYALELARHMAEEIPTTLVTFGDKNETRQIGHLDVHILGPSWYVRGQRTNPLAASLLSYIRRADVVHCHQRHILASTLASALCRLTGRRVFVSDLGGGGFDLSNYMPTDGWFHGHLHISEYSRKVFGHSGKRWAHVIYGGVDHEKFSPASPETRDGTVVFVGRMMPHKGIDNLIKAMPADMKLEIIGREGDPGYYQDLVALAEGKRVVFQRECDDAGLVGAYERALCVVLPSVYKTMYGAETTIPELLGQTLLEGMACGAPAICTDVASMPEVVRDGVTGFVVPPNDPGAIGERIRWLRDHPAEARAMGSAARRHVIENFSWPVVVRRCLSIYGS